MNNNRIWTLLARKLTFEASIHELHELNEWMQANVDMAGEIKTITLFWQESKEKITAEAEIAFEKLWRKINE